jgi:hypothetical protein
MRPLTLEGILLIALAGAILLSPQSGAAQPAPCLGRYQVDGDALDLGSPASDVDGIAVVEAVGGGLGVRLLAACNSFVATQAPRTDAFAIRSRFRDCGTNPRFRLRLLFAPDCQSFTGRVRARGQVVAEFTASKVAALPVDPGDPVAPDAPDATDPVPPTDDAASTPIGDTPRISAFAPLAAEQGTQISVFGTNLDRDQNGDPWTGSPPYRLEFRGVDFPAFVPAAFTFSSPTELRVIVPPAAVSGTLRLSVRRFGRPPLVLAETAERFVIVRDTATVVPPPVQGTAPATANNGVLVIQDTNESALTPGTFPVSGAQNRIGAFLDFNNNGVVDLGGGRNDVPYLAFPVRSSEFDFAIEQGRGYFTGANAVLWVFFEGGNPAVLDEADVFVAVHLNVDLARRTVRPVALVAGPAGDPGIIVSTDQFTAASITVEPPVVGAPGALRGQLSAVASFLQLIFIPSQPSVSGPDFGPEIEQRLIANGFELTFDVPLFNDAA